MRFWSGIALSLSALFVWNSPLRGGQMRLTNELYAIVDGSSVTRAVTVTSLTPGFDTGIITGVTITITFTKSTDESPTAEGVFTSGTPYFNEIVFRLDSPLAPSTALISQGSFTTGANGFYGAITFDDTAPQAVNYDTASPHAGTFKPVGSPGLSQYVGTSALGDWSLWIQDTTGADKLQFYRYALDITTEGGVPEPASAPAVIGGLAALWVAVRRGRARQVR